MRTPESVMRAFIARPHIFGAIARARVGIRVAKCCFLALASSALLLSHVTPVPAQTAAAQPEYALKIPQLPLVRALHLFSEQTGLQVSSYLPTTVDREILVGPVEGRLTAEAALAQLLNATSLSFSRLSDRTVSIKPDPAKRPRVGTGASIENGKKPNAQTSARKQHGPPQSGAEEASGPGSTSDGLPVQQTIEEVEVTGTRFGRNGDQPGLIKQVSRAEIDQLGVSTLGDMVRYFSQQPFAHGEGYHSTGAQPVQLHGLGGEAALVLLNGRRMAPSANSLAFNIFDLNSIPVTAVDRVDVLSDSASAIYGADAMGGVVNVIVKRGAEPPQAFVHYGSADGGADERRASLSGGYEIGRLNAWLLLDYFDRGFLDGMERDRWRNQDYRRFGGLDYRVASSNPGNISSLSGRPLPGLPSAGVAVPAGSTGIGMRTEDFLATAGQTNLESIFQSMSIIPATERASALAMWEFECSPDLAAFGELFYADTATSFHQLMQTLSRAVVPASNAFNPFGEAVAVDYAFVGEDPETTNSDTELLRTVAGLRGELRSWDWEVALLRTEDDATISRVNTLAPDRVRSALASSDPSTALNVFRDGPAGSEALLDSLKADPTVRTYSSRVVQASAFLRGPAVTLPAGSSELVVGGEWREEHILYDDLAFVSETRDVSAAFMELKVPLVSTVMALPGIQQLSTSVAARIDRYGGYGDTFNPQYGLVWRPATDWQVRAFYGTGFRPPSLVEFYLPVAYVPFLHVDARRGNAASPIRVATGGSRDLQPVDSRSFSTGFLYTPSNVPDLRIAGSYWRIVMDNRIVIPSFHLLVAAEDDFPGRVTRAQPTAQDIAAGYPGALQAVNITRINSGRVETSGIDLEMTGLWETRVGSFKPTLAVTWVHEYKAVDMTSMLPSDRVGLANTQGTIPEWRLVGSLAWSVGGMGWSVAATHIPRYRDADLTGRPTGTFVSSQTTVDLQGSLQLDDLFGDTPLFGGLKVSVGVLNLLDEEPDFAWAGWNSGYDVSQGSLKQRFAYLRLSKTF